LVALRERRHDLLARLAALRVVALGPLDLGDLFDAFERLELNLELARITTEKGVAMDTFYLTRETDGGKVVSEREIRKLQRTLHEAAVSGRNPGK